VIALQEYVHVPRQNQKRNRDKRPSRNAILKRDGHSCQVRFWSSLCSRVFARFSHSLLAFFLAFFRTPASRFVRVFTQYCGTRPSDTVDHVTPKCLGGLNTWTNLVCACRVSTKYVYTIATLTVL
jgi:5-methylcytosine-specific restriction endonuclease McrA